MHSCYGHHRNGTNLAVIQINKETNEVILMDLLRTRKPMSKIFDVFIFQHRAKIIIILLLYCYYFSIIKSRAHLLQCYENLMIWYDWEINFGGGGA